MTHKFLKIAGVKDEASFYKKFPTEDAFFKAHPNAHPSYAKGLKNGGKIKKAAWGASLGTDPFIGGPGDPVPLNLNGTPLMGADGKPISTSPSAWDTPQPLPPGARTNDTYGNQKFMGSIPGGDPNPAWQNFAPLTGATQPPTDPNRPNMITNRDYIPNQGEGQLNKGQTPNLTPGQKANDKNAIDPNAKKPNKLSMPDGANTGGFAGQGILAGLNLYSAFMKDEKKRRRYVRPEDIQSYNPNQYGTNSQALSEYGSTLKGKKKAFWGALIGEGIQQAKKVTKGLQENIGNAMAPILNIANNRMDERARLDSLDIQNTANLQNPQAILPGQPVIKQPYNPNAVQYMNYGGEMKYNHGGELMTGQGGNTELKSYNPYDGGTMQFNGDSHEEGGIDIDFKGEQAEVEGGETAFKDKQGDLKIMGNLKVPGTNMKYKALSKQLALKEQKAQKLIDKGTALINTANPEDSYEKLSFNAGKAMTTGGLKKQKELADLKEHLGNMQEAHLEVAKEKKTSPEKVFKDGGTQEDPTKPWVYKGTKVKNLDSKIKEFMTLLEKNGIEGYSGAQGGYRNSKTTSGRTSRHSKNQALDIIPTGGEDTYQQILQKPELVKFMMDNGLTAINEYDPNIAKKTGATAGHIHIGLDKGTKVADQFRQDAASLYPDIYSTEPMYKMNDARGELYTAKQLADVYDMSSSDIKSRVKSGTLSFLSGVAKNYKEPVLNQGAGDAQTENYNGFTNTKFNVPPMNYTPKPGEIQTVQPGDTPIDLHQPPPLNKPSNARGISPLQFLGEGYALATNQEEPVKAQLYNPELYNPYQVSFQDRLNENEATFRNVEQQLAYDPTSLSTLAGQKYASNSGVLADEFRTNQSIANDITNKNVSLLNEAKFKNLGILDQQYVRQSQAKSNTKRVNQEALNNISSKMLQKEASNNQLKVYENLYPDYAFNKRTGRAEYYGPDAASNIDWSGVQPVGTQPDRTKVATKSGNTTTTQYYEDPIDQAIKAKKLQDAQLNQFAPKPISLTKLFKQK